MRRIARTSRSPMIRDAHDFRAGIHDRIGQVLLQAFEPADAFQDVVHVREIAATNGGHDRLDFRVQPPGRFEPQGRLVRVVQIQQELPAFAESWFQWMLVVLKRPPIGAT